MVISKKNYVPQWDIQVNGEILKPVERYNYLKTIILSNGSCLSEIRARIVMAILVFSKMKIILTIKKISIALRENELKWYIKFKLLYAS